MRAVAAVLVLLALAGCGGSTAGEVEELASVTPVQEAFDDDRGAARLVFLFSPT